MKGLKRPSIPVAPRCRVAYTAPPGGFKRSKSHISTKTLTLNEKAKHEMNLNLNSKPSHTSSFTANGGKRGKREKGE